MATFTGHVSLRPMAYHLKVLDSLHHRAQICLLSLLLQDMKSDGGRHWGGNLPRLKTGYWLSPTSRKKSKQKQVLCLIHLLIHPSSKAYFLGFPGGAVVENPPANAGDMGSSPGLGRSHMSQSNWARESQLLSLRVWSLCSTTREAVIVRGPRTAMKSGPHLPQLEEALAQRRGPNTAING